MSKELLISEIIQNIGEFFLSAALQCTKTISIFDRLRCGELHPKQIAQKRLHCQRSIGKAILFDWCPRMHADTEKVQNIDDIILINAS